MNTRMLLLKILSPTYRNQKRYWTVRWNLGIDRLDAERDARTAIQLNRFMLKNDCHSILDVGCGKYKLHGLEGYTSLDFSNAVDSDIRADITDRIPLPDNTFDIVYSSAVLMHISPFKIVKAIHEIERVAKKFVILNESVCDEKLQRHCFFHDYSMWFNFSSKKLVRYSHDAGFNHW